LDEARAAIAEWLDVPRDMFDVGVWSQNATLPYSTSSSGGSSAASMTTVA
jgi:hypothetical protein